MNDQERMIVGLLLNEMAFEGAAIHFHEEPPEIPETLLARIEEIGTPERYDGNTESYHYARVTFNAHATIFDKCYTYLRTVRNNIIHANKAYKPDTPERLQDLLAWAHDFIAAVYETGSPFAQRAQEIKAVMRIESF